MPKPKNKTWVKSKQIIVTVGFCRYCHKELINTDSFVSFYGGGHSHYQCMREDDDLKQKVLNYLEVDVPLTSSDYDVTYVFNQLSDSLSLAKNLYPKLLQFSTIDE